MPLRNLSVVLLAFMPAIAFAQPAEAPKWPNRPVKIIAPFAPGGSSDAMARIVAQHLSETLGTSFVVENRAGAGGSIAAEAVMRAPPDGYTLFWGTANQLGLAPAVAKTSYDPVNDFVPISIFGATHSFS